VYDERLLGPELSQCLGHRPDVVAVKDADELPPGPGRVRQGAQQVEDGPEGQLRPHGNDVAHRRVMGAGEHKPDPDLIYAPADRFGSKPYLRTERFEDVGRAGLARGGPVAVFGDHYAGPPRHESRRCRDVDGSLRVSTGAAGVYDSLGGCDLFGEAAHGAGETDYLPDGLAPHPQGGEQGRGYHRVGRA
jgi:hypothetical protein